jgi:hypothetical protein
MSLCTYFPLLLAIVNYKPLSVSRGAVHMVHLNLDNAGNRSLCQAPTIPSHMQGTVTKECPMYVTFARKNRYKLLLLHVLSCRKRRLLQEGPRSGAK